MGRMGRMGRRQSDNGTYKSERNMLHCAPAPHPIRPLVSSTPYIRCVLHYRTPITFSPAISLFVSSTVAEKKAPRNALSQSTFPHAFKPWGTGCPASPSHARGE